MHNVNGRCVVSCIQKQIAQTKEISSFNADYKVLIYQTVRSTKDGIS